jgi:A/G-specific adenine glycosylase
MGYDRRALNLRRAARAIVADHDGTVPRDIATLEALPGIGPYTARAVASIAFGAPVGAVDTNVRRVLGRSLGAADPEVVERRGWLQVAADASVDPDRPGDWTHALMDLGATVCAPRNPSCEACPLRPWCRFAAERDAASRTVGPEAPGRPPRARSRGIPFPATTRWLRGRIVDRLRGAEGQAWSRVDAPIGAHDERAVRSALVSLEKDGVVELDPSDGARARLALD